MSHRHRHCCCDNRCCCKPVCRCENNVEIAADVAIIVGTGCGNGSGIWLILLLLGCGGWWLRWLWRRLWRLVS